MPARCVVRRHRPVPPQPPAGPAGASRPNPAPGSPAALPGEGPPPVLSRRHHPRRFPPARGGSGHVLPRGLSGRGRPFRSLRGGGSTRRGHGGRGRCAAEGTGGGGGRLAPGPGRGVGAGEEQGLGEPRWGGVSAGLGTAVAPRGWVAGPGWGLPGSRGGGDAQRVAPAGFSVKKRRKKEKRALPDEDVAVSAGPPARRGLPGAGLGEPGGFPRTPLWRHGGTLRGAGAGPWGMGVGRGVAVPRRSPGGASLPPPSPEGAEPVRGGEAPLVAGKSRCSGGV